MTSKVRTLKYVSKSDEIAPPQAHLTCNPIEPARADRMSAVFLKRIKKSPKSHQNVSQMRSNWEVWGYLGDDFGVLEGPGATLEFRWILGRSQRRRLGARIGVGGG